MFRAEPLLKIRLLILASEAADAALELARFGIYSPAQYAPEALSENPAAAYREAWLEAESRVTKLLERCGGLPEQALPEGAAAPTLADLEELNSWLKAVWAACLAAHEGETHIQEEVLHLAALQASLSKLEQLNVDLAQLLRPDGLLAVNIGSLPAASVKRASEALAMTGSLVSIFDTVGDQVYAVIAGPRERHEEVRGLLAQAGWRELPVPAELRAHPQAARAWLIEESQRVKERSGAECAAMDKLRGQYRPGLEEARLRVALARPLAEAAVLGVRGRGGLASLSGWIPRRRANELKAALEARFHGQYWLDMVEAQADEAAQTPSLVYYPRWLMPFVPLVKSYGIPRYGEFDPSLLFAAAYLLLFGAMFGDVGHGGVIVLFAALLYRKLGRTAWVGIGAGLVSMGFGLLYGSVFGYEDILTPLWLSPLHEPTRLLRIAILFGVGFIVFTLLANIYNKLNAGHWGEALFDSGGVAGLLFYLGATGSLMCWADFEGLAESAYFGQLAGGLAGFGLAAVAVFKWLETPASPGERVMVAAIETLETGIKLFANTLSFMRVAAFSLNHVALALAVFTIANNLGSAGYWLTIVLGNVIIIALEGGIVAIQALRLMYFEGFSRFFSGDGQEFIPLKLENAKQRFTFTAK
jgi:V/A-type H+-transporting ATPase subunit I